MKKITALLLILLMALSIAPVASSDETPTKMRYLTPGTDFPMQDYVLNLVNQSLKDFGYNLDVSFIRIPWDAYEQKLNAMLAAGEEFEMLHIMQDVKNISYLASRNGIIPIDDYLDKYPNILDKFSETEWLGAMYNGKTYAVPARWRDFSRNGYLVARGDVLDKVTGGKDPETFDEFLDVCLEMQKVIEEEIGRKPYFWYHQLANSAPWLYRTFDTFPFLVQNGLLMARQDGTIECYIETEEFKQECEAMYRLYHAGIIYPDILNAVHTQKYDEFNIGAALPSPTFGWGDQVALQENIPDAYVKLVWLAPEKPSLMETLCQNLQGISATAEDPEAGLMFLDWLYAKRENHDLFCYGVEGETFTASAPDRYEPIKNEEERNLYAFDTWMIGYISWLRFGERYPQEGIEFDTTSMPLGDGAGEAVLSVYAGFQFDPSNVEFEYASLQTELIASVYPLKFGLVSYEEGYEAAISALKAAGLDAYMNEVTKQYTEFIAAKAK